MSHTPTSSAPSGNATAQQEKKPILTGVRIKQRKGQAKAASKFEPESFRDALLLHLFLLPTPITVDSLVAKLVQAGATLEFLRYYEQLFEVLFLGGLLQPGGSYLDDKRSPVYIVKEGEREGPMIVETLKRVIQRYKYLQKPLEENFLPSILGYIHKWSPEARTKLAEALALIIVDLQISPRCLSSLVKDHVVKDNIALDFLTSFFKTFLSKQNVDVLGSTLRKSGLKDIALVFPIQVRDKRHLAEHFSKEGLEKINEWYAKVALGESEKETVANVSRMVNEEETSEQMIETLKTQQAEAPVTDADLVEWIWHGLMRALDLSGARADQSDSMVVHHITTYAPVLEAFCNGARAEVNLINAVQVYCYTDTRVIKAFPQILKVLYNADCISDQAILYWHSKGAKPQGKQHFLKVTEPLIKFLEAQESEEE
ncbi:hypothetical protein M231_05954 [Tremella mesenterica]|uniref:W2 domain-containing protein n=1 Tax=Tremella mesenterica TaxID=5217 RepID=A0A4Q1BGT4_TREME|nr:hypothetical protein M231_05954 [Tremella mesenterica]